MRTLSDYLIAGMTITVIVLIWREKNAVDQEKTAVEHEERQPHYSAWRHEKKTEIAVNVASGKRSLLDAGKEFLSLNELDPPIVAASQSSVGATEPRASCIQVMLYVRNLPALAGINVEENRIKELEVELNRVAP